MTADFFALFDLPHHFDLNLADLQKRYFEAQRRFHPDRLVGKQAAERQQAIAQSMQVNEAYEALKAPLSRAQHMLALSGITQNSVKPSQELLMKIMELREALSEASSLPALNEMAAQSEASMQQALASLSEAFAKLDYEVAAQLAMRLSYLSKLADEIRIRRKTPAN